MKSDGSETAEMQELNLLSIQRSRTQIKLMKAQLEDLGNQTRAGIVSVERLANILEVILDDHVTFSDGMTRIYMTDELLNARYFLQTGHLAKRVEEQLKGEDDD